MKDSLFKFSKKTLFYLFCFFNTLIINAQLTIPYEFENSSRYSDDEIYIGLVGKTNELGDVWMDMTNSQLQVMSADDNTIPGPDFSYPKEWLYPEIFVKLSDINNNTIQIPQGLFACRIFISFESPMYLHFHETGGYAGANLNNPGDPNDGIRWEIVELTWGDAGLWTNTSRVDAYQYPMALEVSGFSGGVTGTTYESSYNRAISGSGTPQFKRIGEVLPHDEILAAWDNMVSDPYKVAKVIKDNSIDGEPIIEQPSKVAEFTDDILDDYIDDIWETYKNYDLNINIGDRGTWIGRVQADDTVLFTDPTDGSIATIHGKPNTINAMEGSGFLAYTPTLASEDVETYDEDLLIQAQMAAAITRHAIYTNIIDGSVQFTHDADRFFVIEPFNEYVEFFHNEAISFESQTYAFAYDDVGDHSSTIQTTFPTDVKVIIGGYGETPVTTNEKTNFIPDPNKNYYIDSPIHNLRIAAEGNTERPYTTSTTELGDNVEWKFIDRGNGYWQIELAASGTKPRLRSNNTANADMQPTSSNGGWTYYDFAPGASDGTYFMTLPDGPNNFKRLQINNTGGVKMVSTANAGTWESFTFTEVSAADSTTANTTLFIEAEDFTDMNGVQLESVNDINGGQNVGYIDTGDWIEYNVTIPATGTYTFSTRVASVPGNGLLQIETNGTIVGTVAVETTGGWQSWTTLNTNINLSAGTQTIRLSAISGGWNINWLEFENQSNTSAKDINVVSDSIIDIIAYPVPAQDYVNIKISNFENYSNINIVDMNGRVVTSSNIESSVTEIAIDHISSGFYWAAIYQNGVLAHTLQFVK